MTEDVPSAATDGKTLFFNPKYVELLDPLALCGLVTHELLHAALQHGVRRRERDPGLWNISADIVVNGMIRKDTAYTLPEGGVENAVLAHLSVEEIYEQLEHGKVKVPALTLQDLLVLEADAHHATSGCDHLCGEEAQRQQRYWSAALQQASAVARRNNKGFGRLGLDSSRDYKGAILGRLSWREMLWQFMVATPYDFGGYDRRFIHQKLYLEDIVGESVDVAICIDTSGSIADRELGEFMGETQGILNAYPQIKGNLFFADANLYGPYPFSIDAPIPKAKGGGGTSFEPFFEWISRESGAQPLCIYFTDGYGSFPIRLADANVLWVVLPGGLESTKFPFGTVARLG